ncbi:MAG TPA: DUF4430 domain-containing protein [Patescibacteria group bacterium]|nr:DUF4430 domain-containing protein [Patescibacteria group bacterium]
MNKYKSIALIVFLLIFAALVHNYLKERSNYTQIPNEKVTRDFKPTLTINNGTSTTFFDATPYLGKSVLEATLTATQGKVVLKDSKITSVNGYTARDDKKEFWELFVNGISSKTSADKYIIKNGDQIEWHINIHS